MYGVTVQGSFEGAPLDPHSRPLTRESSNEQHRGLTVCDACRQRRSRCTFEVAVPVCGQCMLRGTKCSTSYRRSKIGLMKRSQRARILEAEVQRMENILRSAGIDPGETAFDIQLGENDDVSCSDIDDNYEDYNGNTSSPELKSSDCCSSPWSTSSVYADSPNQPLTLKTSRRPEGIFYGHSSMYHILSHQGVEFIEKASGVTDFPNRILSQPCWSPLAAGPWPYSFYADLFDRHVYKALPPRSEVFALIKVYFRTINRVFPIINEKSFMRVVEWQYTRQECRDVAIWAIINAILAISIGYRNKHYPSDKDTEKAWLYWKNAADVYTELALRPHSLVDIQALLVMAIFARLNSRLRLEVPLVTAAMKGAQALGLHRRNVRPDLSLSEQEVRKRVWWCIYTMDEAVGVKTGTGNLHVDDIDVELPSEDPEAPSENGCTWSVKLFRASCSLSVVRCNIYRELYATQAFYKPLAEVCQTAESLNTQLNKLKQENPCLFCKLRQNKTLDRDQELELITHITYKLCYLNSLALINRMPILFEVARDRAAWKRAHPDQNHIEQVSASSRHHSLICLHAAQDSLRLLEKLPLKYVAFGWAVHDYIFFAASIIFTHILRVPLCTDIGSPGENLNLLNLAKDHFATLSTFPGRAESVGLMAVMTSAMQVTARKVIDKATKAKNNSSSQRGKQQEGLFNWAPEQQQYLPSKVGQTTTNVQFSDASFVQMMPFPEDLAAENAAPMDFGFNTTDLFFQNPNFGFSNMAPMPPEQSIKMTGANPNMYTDVYGYDRPSYIGAPVPNAMWVPGNVPNIPGSMSSEMKYDPSMSGDAILGYMWNSNG